MRNLRELGHEANANFVHLITHTFIVIFGCVLFTTLVPARFSGDWYDPAEWAPCLILGFFLNRHWRHPSACFIWACGLLWFAYVSHFPSPSISDWFTCMAQKGDKLYFPIRAGAFSVQKNSCYMVGTIPVLNSVSYSIGAALGILIKTKPELRFTPSS